MIILYHGVMVIYTHVFDNHSLETDRACSDVSMSGATYLSMIMW